MLTVVIIGWNQGRFLADAVESVLPQLADPSQLIIVDNGSTDNTPQIARTYAGVRYLFQENAGPSGARNTGLAEVATPLVLFLDADDMLAPGALAAAHAALAQAPDAPLAYGGFCEVDAQGRLLFEVAPDPRGRTFAGLLTGNHIAMHGTVLYRAEALRRAGGFDVGLKSCEDYDVYLRLARTGTFATYPLTAARYRRHAESATRDAALMLRSALVVMRRHRPTREAPAELRVAYREGLGFWRDYYGERLVGQIMRDLRQGRTRRLTRDLVLALTSDPAFAARVFGRAAGRLLGARRRPSPQSSSSEGNARASSRGDRKRGRQD